MIPNKIVDNSPDARAVVFAEDQPQYLQLPAVRYAGAEGLVVTHWQLTWKERFRVLFGSGIFLALLTFGQPLQPIKLGTTAEEVK